MLDILQFHHLVREEFERPALPPIGSLATGQMNQMGLALAIQAATFGPFAGKASGEGYLQVSLHKPLLDANHRATTNGESLGNLSIGCLWLTLALVTHEQHAGHHIVL